MHTVAIIGSGVVGKATGQGLTSWGYDVVYCDVDPVVIDEIASRGERVVTPEELLDIHTDLTFITVATPTVNGHIHLEPLRQAIITAARRLAASDKYEVVVLRSTAPPGTTSNIFIPLLEEISGRTYGADFGVCYNPEFLRESTALQDFFNPWLVVIGAEDDASLSALQTIYAKGVPPDAQIHITDFKTAEMIKCTSNLFNAAKISFTNEIWLCCRRLAIDGNEVMAAVLQSAEGLWNHSYGTKGGYPYGGACLPKDTLAFYTFARSLGLSMDLLNAVISINERMAELINWESPIAGQRGLKPLPERGKVVGALKPR